MNKTGRRRLEKLEQHLRKGKLFHDKFNFGTWHSEDECGTSGCAIGECVKLFPSNWKWVGDIPTLKKVESWVGVIGSGREFFDINYDEFNHLFLDGFQEPKLYGGRNLGPRATPLQVANNIHAFLQRQDV